MNLQLHWMNLLAKLDVRPFVEIVNALEEWSSFG